MGGNQYEKLKLNPKPLCNKCRGTKTNTKDDTLCKKDDGQDCDGRMPLQSGFDFTTTYLESTSCKILEVWELRQHAEDSYRQRIRCDTYELYAIAITVPPEGKTHGYKYPLKCAEGEEESTISPIPYWFPLRITNCSENRRNTMEKGLRLKSGVKLD